MSSGRVETPVAGTVGHIADFMYGNAHKPDMSAIHEPRPP